MYLVLSVYICYVYFFHYNTSSVYCRELAPGTVSLTGNWVHGDDSKQNSYYILPTMEIIRTVLQIAHILKIPSFYFNLL